MRVGRIPALTPERVKEILALLQVGNTDEVAANASGISRTTFYKWLVRGRAALERMEKGEEIDDEEMRYADFVDGVKRAKAEAIATAVTHVRRAMSKNWTAAMTFLERRDPENWGRKDRVDVHATGIIGISRLSKEEQALVQENLLRFFPALGTPKEEDKGE
jgi:transposase